MRDGKLDHFFVCGEAQTICNGRCCWCCSVNNSETRNCAKFQPFVTCNFAKNCDFSFLQFCVFCLFDLQNNLKFQI